MKQFGYIFTPENEATQSGVIISNSKKAVERLIKKEIKKEHINHRAHYYRALQSLEIFELN